MKYLYLYFWIGFALLHLKVFSKILIPINWIIIRLRKSSNDDYDVWRKRYNKAKLDFPNGINGWYAFGTLILFISVPILILIVNMDLSIDENKSYILAFFSLIIIFCYYWIYYKNEKWLKEEISKRQEEYHIN